MFLFSAEEKRKNLLFSVEEKRIILLFSENWKKGKISFFPESGKYYPPTGGKYSVSLTVTGERKAAESRAAVLPSPVRDKNVFCEVIL